MPVVIRGVPCGTLSDLEELARALGRGLSDQVLVAPTCARGGQSHEDLSGHIHPAHGEPVEKGPAPNPGRIISDKHIAGIIVFPHGCEITIVAF